MEIKEVMKIRIKKVYELDDALKPNNILEGFEAVIEIEEMFFKPPTIGKRFNIKSFITSPVQEIISESLFKTNNSIYEWGITS